MELGGESRMEQIEIPEIANSCDLPIEGATEGSKKCSSIKNKNWTEVSEILGLVVLFFFLWGIFFALFPDFMEPTTTFMRMVFLVIGAQIVGSLVNLVKIPDILGMIVWGIIYKNVGWGDFSGFEEFESVLREIALVSIMLLAGLDLDYLELKSRIFLAIRLIFVPTIAEVFAITIVGHYLFNMPWLWSCLMGLVITPVSPNVVISILLDLKEKGLGSGTGIHTIIIAMTGLDDVLSVFLFGIVLGIIYSTGDLTSQVLQGPVGVVIGLIFGVGAGFFCLKLPSKLSIYSDSLRTLLIFTGGAVSVLGCSYLGYPSGGALGCIVLAFVIRTQWGTTSENNVQPYLDLVWTFLKPVSFSLIGKEMDFSVLDGKTILYGVIVVLLGLLFRLLSGYFSTYGGGFTWQERAFVTISSVPKATIQATIGPVALDMAKKTGNPVLISLATIVLICSVLSIIMTAPLGALLMTYLAPRWLSKGSSPEIQGTNNAAFDA